MTRSCPRPRSRRRGSTQSRHIGPISRGGPGQRDDNAAVGQVDPPAGRGAALVGDRRGRGNEPRLLEVRLGERQAPPFEEVAQPALQLRIHGRLLAAGPRRSPRGSDRPAWVPGRRSSRPGRPPRGRSRRAAATVASRSGRAEIQSTSTPASDSDPARSPLFVSRVSPMVSSLPTASSTAVRSGRRDPRRGGSSTGVYGQATLAASGLTGRRRATACGCRCVARRCYDRACCLSHTEGGPLADRSSSSDPVRSVVRRRRPVRRRPVWASSSAGREARSSGLISAHVKLARAEFAEIAGRDQAGRRARRDRPAAALPGRHPGHRSALVALRRRGGLRLDRLGRPARHRAAASAWRSCWSWRSSTWAGLEPSRPSSWRSASAWP